MAESRQPASPPTLNARRSADPIELWPGSVPERRADGSWTRPSFRRPGDATGSDIHRPFTGHLYRTGAPPSALLAYSTNRNEDECVLDTDGLTVTEVPLQRDVGRARPGVAGARDGQQAQAARWPPSTRPDAGERDHRHGVQLRRHVQ